MSKFKNCVPDCSAMICELCVDAGEPLITGITMKEAIEDFEPHSLRAVTCKLCGGSGFNGKIYCRMCGGYGVELVDEYNYVY